MTSLWRHKCRYVGRAPSRRWYSNLQISSTGSPVSCIYWYTVYDHTYCIWRILSILAAKLLAFPTKPRVLSDLSRIIMLAGWIPNRTEDLTPDRPVFVSYAVGRTTRRHPATMQQSYLVSIAFVLATFMSSPVHRRTSSIHAVLLPGKHFPSISPLIVARTTLSLLLSQWQYLERFWCLICCKMPCSSGIPIFSWIHVLVFRSVQLILNIRRHTHMGHISKAVTVSHRTDTCWQTKCLMSALKTSAVLFLF